jgi:hypothetical protein
MTRKGQAKAEPSTEVVAPSAELFDMEELRNIETFDDALALVQSQLGGVAVASDELGDGFALISTAKDKDKFCGVPVIFLSWAFNAGDFGDFVSARIVARQDGGSIAKAIINDGSTGVFQQLQDYTKQTGKLGGLVARHGLRRSDYEYDDGSGTPKPASTYYIDTSA